MADNPFTAAAGISPLALSTGLRTVLVVLTFIWAVWVTIGTLQNMHAPDFTPATLVLRLFAIVTTIMCCLVLIA